MILDGIQSAALLVLALLGIVILLRILVIVHKQNSKVKELEMRMNAVEQMDEETITAITAKTKED